MVGYGLSGTSLTASVYQLFSHFFGFQNYCVDFTIDTLRSLVLVGWEFYEDGISDPIALWGDAVFGIIPLCANMLMCLNSKGSNEKDPWELLPPLDFYALLTNEAFNAIF
jgi:hypothetical protein